MSTVEKLPSMTKRKPDLKPGDEYLLIGDAMPQARGDLPIGTEPIVGFVFTTERGTFQITKMTPDCVYTKFLSAETEKGPTGDVRV